MTIKVTHAKLDANNRNYPRLMSANHDGEIVLMLSEKKANNGNILGEGFVIKRKLGPTGYRSNGWRLENFTDLPKGEKVVLENV